MNRTDQYRAWMLFSHLLEIRARNMRAENGHGTDASATLMYASADATRVARSIRDATLETDEQLAMAAARAGVVTKRLGRP